MRILVVEDERELAESIAEGLRMDGYSCLLYTSKHYRRQHR